MSFVKFQLRRDTAANWAASSVPLYPGEPGVELDTGKMKIGQGGGPTGWNSLPYLTSGGTGSGSTGDTGATGATGPAGTGGGGIGATGTFHGDYLYWDPTTSAWVVGSTEVSLGGAIIGGFTGQGSRAIAIGADAGVYNQGTCGVAIGTFAGVTGQGQNAVAIGRFAGQINQGIGSIAIGAGAGNASQPDSTIIINAGYGTTGGQVLAPTGNTGAFYVNPIRQADSLSSMLTYSDSTKEITRNPIVFAGPTGLYVQGPSAPENIIGLSDSRIDFTNTGPAGTYSGAIYANATGATGYIGIQSYGIEMVAIYSDTKQGVLVNGQVTTRNAFIATSAASGVPAITIDHNTIAISAPDGTPGTTIASAQSMYGPTGTIVSTNSTPGTGIMQFIDATGASGGVQILQMPYNGNFIASDTTSQTTFTMGPARITTGSAKFTGISAVNQQNIAFDTPFTNFPCVTATAVCTDVNTSVIVTLLSVANPAGNVVGQSSFDVRIEPTPLPSFPNTIDVNIHYQAIGLA